MCSCGAAPSALATRVFAEDARSDRVLTYPALDEWRMAFDNCTLAPGTTVALSMADPLRSRRP